MDGDEDSARCVVRSVDGAAEFGKGPGRARPERYGGFPQCAYHGHAIDLNRGYLIAVF